MAGKDHRKPVDKIAAAKQRQVDDRVRRARPPQRLTAHLEACGDLARETGRDPADLMDLFDEMATSREYLGNVSRHEAEALAMEDVIAQVTRQRRLA